MSDVNLQGSFGGQGGSSLSFRNILINGEVTRINQRGFDGNWAGLSNGDYGYDRWKKADASNISQIVEEGNFIPDAEYVLSGTNVTTQVVTAPSSGNWTIAVPNTASYVQLERGSVASPFEHRPIGLELSLCKRYYYKINTLTASAAWMLNPDDAAMWLYHPVEMRGIPVGTINATENTDIRFYYSGAYSTTGNWACTSESTEGFRLDVTDTSRGAGGGAGAMYLTGVGNIELDAEL